MATADNRVIFSLSKFFSMILSFCYFLVVFILLILFRDLFLLIFLAFFALHKETKINLVLDRLNLITLTSISRISHSSIE